MSKLVKQHSHTDLQKFHSTESLPRRFSRSTTFMGQLRQILLVTHNSVLNGLANLYVHNNLEIFIQKIKGEDEDEKQKSSKVTYMTSDVRQRTLVRQLVFDLVILVENVVMVYLAKDTVMVAKFDDPTERESSYANIHLRIAVIIAAAYALGMAMKVEVFRVRDSEEFVYT